MATFPTFRRLANGKLIVRYTKEASDVMKRKNKPSGQSQNPDEVSARSEVILIYRLYLLSNNC